MRRAFVTLVIALMLCASSLHADPAGDARAAIRSAYAAVDAAMARKDVAGVTAFCAPDFTSTDIHGTVSGLAQEQQAATRLFSQAQSVSSKTIVLSCALDNPAQTTVTERSHIVMILPATAQTGKPLKAVLGGTARDTWVKTGGVWREKHDQALTEIFTVNGKALPNS